MITHGLELKNKSSESYPWFNNWWYWHQLLSRVGVRFEKTDAGWRQNTKCEDMDANFYCRGISFFIFYLHLYLRSLAEYQILGHRCKILCCGISIFICIYICICGAWQNTKYKDMDAKFCAAIKTKRRSSQYQVKERIEQTTQKLPNMKYEICQKAVENENCLVLLISAAKW